MKKIIFYLLFIISLIILLPVIFTNEFETTEVSKEIDFDYGEYSNIKLLHAGENKVEELPLDEYLYGVVASEMPASFDLEALKAQAIVARTYTIYQISNNSKHENAHICDNSLCCQAWISKENRFARWEDDKENEYWEKVLRSVNETKGKIIYYDDKPINAFFHSNSGGKTELALNVWGGDYPYLKTVETSGEDAYTSYKSEVVISKDELVKKMLEKYPDFYINFEDKDTIKIEEYTDSSRVKKIKIGNKVLSGVEARTLFGLKSSNFIIEILENEIKFSVTGYGHGVGFSQCGSDQLAKQGMKCEEIIKHYYKDVSINE